MTTTHAKQDRSSDQIPDPRSRYPQPPFPRPEEQQDGGKRPEPAPDHGEQSYRGSGRLAGRHALITGADSGIGRAVAIAFAREGADVVVGYHSDHQGADEVVDLVKAEGGQSVAISADLREESECQRLVEEAVAALGALDTIVLNAAYQRTKDLITEITREQLETTYETNIFAMFAIVQAALPHLKPGSTIVTTSSIQGFQPSPNLLDYATTKGAIVVFTKSLAEQVAERGIRVNSVAPGPVWTPLVTTTMPPEKVEKFGEDTLLGRPAQPVELAPAYVFLAGDESSFVTGETIGVTGGRFLT